MHRQRVESLMCLDLRMSCLVDSLLIIETLAVEGLDKKAGFEV